LRFVAFLLALYALLRSGGRQHIILGALFFFISYILRSGWKNIIRGGLIAVPLMAIVIAGHGHFYTFPNGVQRALSFLPGEWSPEIKERAEGDWEWRLVIWRKVWFSKNEYIENWWVGDGFGLSRERIATAAYLQLYAGMPGMQEAYAYTGNYHSLPLSIIRVGGYVGFILFTILMVGMSAYGYRLVRRAQNTPYLPFALMACIPAMVFFWQDMVITGFFDQSVLAAILAVMWMRLLERSMQAHMPALYEAKDPDALPGNGLPALPETPFPGRPGFIPLRLC